MECDRNERTKSEILIMILPPMKNHDQFLSRSTYTMRFDDSDARNGSFRKMPSIAPWKAHQHAFAVLEVLDVFRPVSWLRESLECVVEANSSYQEGQSVFFARF